MTEKFATLKVRLANCTPWKRPAVRLGVLAAAWVLALVLVAIPSLRTAMVRHQEVRQLEQGLAELDTWTVAGKWLELSLPRRQAAIDPVWEQTFPLGRNREQFFLELAEVADHSGVKHFNLSELTMDQPGMEAMPSTDADQPAMFGGSVYGVPVEVPSITLDSYRVKASFQGGYRQAAQFMGGLRSIPRAVNVHDLTIRPESDGIRVDLELDVYVSQQS